MPDVICPEDKLQVTNESKGLIAGNGTLM